MAGGLITGLGSAIELLTQLSGAAESVTFCLYRVVDGVETLIYEGAGPTFSYPNPGICIEQTYRLYVCGDPCGDSGYDEAVIPIDPSCGDSGGGDEGWVITPIPTTPPWDRDCAPTGSSWSQTTAPATSWSRVCRIRNN